MPCIAFLAAVLVAPAGAQSPTRADRVKTVAPDNDQDVGKKKLPRGDASSSQRSVTTRRTPAVRQSGATRSAPPPSPVTRSMPPVRSETAPAVRQPRITPTTVENRAKLAETYKGGKSDVSTPPPPPLPPQRDRRKDGGKGILNLGHGPLPRAHSSQGKAVPYAALKTRFPERAKSGNLDHLVAGGTAQKIKLADQYRLWHNGDVARQLGLEKHTQNFHHGPISPTYQNHCFKYNYWGPAFFAGACWYPSWNPWVEWSWRSHCHPFWDPRPIWCRPVIYNPCPVWGYWQVLVWTPLPVVACGTWVDLKPPALPQDETDLQLAAVRFVDPGHPEEKLGPRYRVWFRNNGSQAITQPFNVMLFAANDGKLSADLPQAGVRITAVEAGDMQSVDIRLPVEVYAMNRDAQGNPAPFNKLNVLVDANRELPETDRVNNGARLAPAEILPVDPAAFELEPATASPGGEMGKRPAECVLCAVIG